MRQKDFIYWLLNEDGKPQIGNIKTMTVSLGDINNLVDSFLKKTPDGWLTVLVKFARNNKYWGLFRDYTVPMKFVKDGQLVLTDLLWRKSYEAYSKMLIYKADRSVWPIKYKPWYSGEIDFTTAVQSRTGLTVNVMEGGLSKLLKAYEDTEYEIELDDIRVMMDGFFLDCSFNYETIRGFDSLEFADIPRGGAHHLIPTVFINGEGTQLNLSHQASTVLLQDVADGYENTSDQWCLKCFGDTTVHIYGRLGIFVGNTISGTYTLQFRTSTNRVGVVYTKTFTAGFDDLFDATFDILEGENVFLEALWTGGGDGVIYTNGGERGGFKIDFKNRFRTTFVKVITAFNLLAKLVEKISDGRYQAKSDFLVNQLKGYVFTCGDALRGFEDAVIKISLKDFFQSVSARFSVGLGIEGGKLMIEDLPYFFKTTVGLDLGSIDIPDDFVTVAKEYIYNTIAAGYKDQNYNDVNGRFEPNSGQKFLMPVTRVVKELDLVSTVRADPFGIEFARINLAGKLTTDASSDNDPFWLNIETDLTNDDNGAYYKLNRPATMTITGVPDPVNIFNILLSPHRGVLNNGRMIHSFLDKIDGVVKFLTGDKNTDLSVEEPPGDPVNENADITIPFLGQRLFLPYLFKVIASIPQNIQDILRDHRYEQIKFTYKGNAYYGYLVDGDVKPATNDKQTWTLLAAANNDMTKLIAA